jgi:signal transduction histidine kinase
VPYCTDGKNAYVKLGRPELTSLWAASERFVANPARLIAVVALVVALPVLVLGEISANDTRQRIRAERLQSTTEAVQRSASIMTERIRSVQAGMAFLSNGELRARIDVELTPGTGNPDRLTSLLNDYRGLLGADVVRLAVARQSGDIAAVSPANPDLIGKKHRMSAVITVNPEQPFSDVYLGDDDSPTIAATAPVQSLPVGGFNRFLGWIVAEVDLGRTLTTFPRLRLATDDLYLIDATGRVILSAPGSGISGRDLASNPVIAGVLAGQPFAGEAPNPLGPGTRLIVSSLVAPRTWFVIGSTQLSDPDVELTLDQFRWTRVVLVALLIAASLLLAKTASETVRNRRVLADANAALSLSNQTIQAQAVQLDQASKNKSEFLANMSHELRTPLNAIIGFSDVLLEGMFGALNPKQQEYLTDIRGSGAHQLSLINDILDLSKVEAGRMELDLALVSIPEAIATGITLVHERAVNHGILLGSEVARDLPLIEADGRKLKQVILNLLTNAVKFTPAGGRVVARADARDGEIVISVADTGVGIDLADQERIFAEFEQTKHGKSAEEGTGLGLTLCKKLVELHGGRIWVESESGAGSTFTFTLPIRLPLAEGSLNTAMPTL